MPINEFIDSLIPGDYFRDPSLLRKSRLLIRGSFLTSLFSTNYIVMSLLFEYDKGVYLMAFNVLGFLVLPFFVKRKISIEVLGNVYVFVGGFAVVFLTYFSGGLWSAIYPWIISIPILALLIVNRKSAIFWGSLSLGFMLWFGYLAIQGVELPIEYNLAYKTEWFVAVLPGLLLITVFIAFVFESIQRSALEKLEEKNETLNQQKDTIGRQAEKLQKLIEDKDYIIRVLAHDLKNPLTNIQAMVTLMNMEKEEDLKVEYTDRIKQSAENAQNLLQRVLEIDVTSQDGVSVNLEELKIHALCDDVVNSMWKIAKNKFIALEFKGDESVKVFTDKTYCTLIIENFLSNAIKFSEPNTTVRIKMEEGHDFVTIRVIDQGPGIAEDEKGELFKKFSKLSARPTAGESSSGLGLSLVKKYAELIHAEVWYEKGEVQGSVFLLKVPKRRP